MCGLKGNFIIPLLKYSHLKARKDGTLTVGSEKDGYGIIQLDGTVIINQKYEKPVWEIKEN